MVNVLSFDSFVRKRKEAALEEAKAREALLKGFVTRAELEELQTKLDAEWARIRDEFEAEVARIQAEYEELRATVNAVQRHVLLTGIALNCLIAVILKLGMGG